MRKGRPPLELFEPANDFGPLVAVVLLCGAAVSIRRGRREPRIQGVGVEPLCRLRLSDVSDALLEGRLGPLEWCLLFRWRVCDPRCDVPCNRIVVRGPFVHL